MPFPALFRYSPGGVRSRLFRDLVGVLLLTAAALAVSAYLLIAEMRRELAWSQIAGAMSLVREEVRRLGEPVERQLRIIRSWGRAGELPFGDPKTLNSRLIPVLGQMPQVSGAILVDESGAEYFLQPEDGSWLTRERGPGPVGEVVWRRWEPGQSTPEATWTERLDYDPRRRPWYENAQQSGDSEQVAWSKPYVFFTHKVPGLTASIGWQGRDGFSVAAMDLTLETVLDTVADLPLADQGRAFLVRPDGSVFTTTGLEPAGSGEGFVSASAAAGGPLAFDTVAGWLALNKPVESPFRFTSGGQDWWGDFAPLFPGTSGAWMGVTVPLAAVGSLVHRQWQLLGGSLAAVLVLGAVLAFFLVRRYSRQIRDLPTLSIRRNDAENDLYRLINDGESEHLEFKSTLRMNLRTGKAGKEIELAWLKGVAAFLNTDGGILLVGVSDEGTVLGLEPDGFENEDKCRLHFKNLLHQHLGAELSRFVRFELYPLDGKQVGAIECERANEPVFLRNKNDESFYIRTGPSNVELSVSRALSYIQARF